jgi:hypothetical protein
MVHRVVLWQWPVQVAARWSLVPLAVDFPAFHGRVDQITEGVSGRLVGPAAFKAVEGSFARPLVGSIPIHSRCFASTIVS